MLQYSIMNCVADLTKIFATLHGSSYIISNFTSYGPRLEITKLFTG
jgi:hypothetical protein